MQKNILLFLLLLGVYCPQSQAQNNVSTFRQIVRFDESYRAPADPEETMLYTQNGDAQAYIRFDDPKEPVFYLLSGEPCAFLQPEQGLLGVVGINHKLLGWYHDNTLYDLRGYVVAVPEDRVKGMWYAQQGMRNIRQPMSIRPIAPLRTAQRPAPPTWTNRWSTMTAKDLLYFGQ